MHSTATVSGRHLEISPSNMAVHRSCPCSRMNSWAIYFLDIYHGVIMAEFYIRIVANILKF